MIPDPDFNLIQKFRIRIHNTAVEWYFVLPLCGVHSLVPVVCCVRPAIIFHHVGTYVVKVRRYVGTPADLPASRGDGRTEVLRGILQNGLQALS